MACACWAACVGADPAACSAACKLCSLPAYIGLSGVMLPARLLCEICDMRVCAAMTNEIPTLPPMLRVRLIKPVALLVFSRGIEAKAITLMGTNRNGMPARDIVQTATKVQKPV